ncbi:hypothetical protein RhiirA1_533780 [Rhizophagus irregularis]|uniref:Uncharacterized protein n=1 Tax=Rhizophagus irregularis TaxID=588596 RepID=A0A2N0S0E0_9GLOM|nr:hypothetical protein RhiirA1_533780 [Rhizophagus irregularis]
MEFKNWIIKFIDTEHFQGLRNIKQLISVAHLSRSLIKRIQETQPELEHDENEADSTLKISDSIFDANEYLKMDDTILNKIEYSNDPKEINEEKIIAYQNNDGLKVDDIIQNSNDTPTNLNNSLPAHYNLEDKVEEDRSIDEDKNVDEDRNIDNYCKEC